MRLTWNAVELGRATGGAADVGDQMLARQDCGFSIAFPSQFPSGAAILAERSLFVDDGSTRDAIDACCEKEEEERNQSEEADSRMV